MKTEELLSAVAVFISVVALTISAWQAWRGEIIGMRPVLVFVYERSEGWAVRNVGNGPAMNVIVAQKECGKSWKMPVRIPPLPSGEVRVLDWLDHSNVHALGTVYADFKGREYTSECANDLSQTISGNQLPTWSETELRKH